jgi:hypothetical protein
MNCKLLIAFPFLLALSSTAAAQEWAVQVTPQWSAVERTLQTVPTYQIVASALMRPTSPIHDRLYQDVHDLQANYMRFSAWAPWPRLAVAEIDAPHDGETHWDFSNMDPVVVDFLEAIKGHPVVMNLATIPEWMYKTDKPVIVPSNPDLAVPYYEQGTELRDPSMTEVADYFARLASWYVKGGFHDENGMWHESGHHYRFDYWEVLNEVDFEHQMTPETYTRVYDAVVEAVRKVDPTMKFIGLAVAATSTVPWEKQNPEFFEYFLNPRNHQPGIPIDGISYHCYGVWTPDQSPAIYQYTAFEDADRFLSIARYVESIRQRLSPKTRSFITELGLISADDNFLQGQPNHVPAPLPNSYWNLAAAFYAYIYNNLSRLDGIETVGMSSGIGYPNVNYPSVTMIDWRTGQPNARYWTLKLLIDHLELGSHEVSTGVKLNYTSLQMYANVQAQAFVTPQGKREILLINKRNRPYEIVIAGAHGGEVEYVDQSTGFHPAAKQPLESQWIDPSKIEDHAPTEPLPMDRFVLEGLGVAVVTLGD